MKKPNTTQILVILVAILLFWNFIKPNFKWIGGDTPQDKITVDSTKIIAETPSKVGEFELRKELQPIIVNNYITPTKDNSIEAQYIALIKDLEKKYNVKADSTIILKDLLEAKKIREYNEKYEDSNVVGNIYTKAQGFVQEQKFSYEIKPSLYEYWEKTYTEEKYPQYSIYIGGAFNSQYNDITGSNFEVNAGLQNRSGAIYELKYNTNGQWGIGYKHRLFTKYKKNDSKNSKKTQEQ